MSLASRRLGHPGSPYERPSSAGSTRPKAYIFVVQALKSDAAVAGPSGSCLAFGRVKPGIDMPLTFRP